MFDFSKYAGNLIAVYFWNPEELYELADGVLIDGKHIPAKSLNAIQKRFQSERMFPYAIAISVSGDGNAEWKGWCDANWYEENGYRMVEISEVRVGEPDEDFSDLEFPLLL